MKTGTTYRLLTRSDFDGLVCAVLLEELGLLDEIKFVHPKDMQDGVIELTSRDITTNLPYVDGVHLCFDHHSSETVRTGAHENHIIDPEAESAARVVYDYYGGKKAFPPRYSAMLEAADKIDAARYTMEDVLAPEGWTLLGFITDSRTGLGRFKHFRISNYDLMMDLIGYCRTKRLEEILAVPDVKERIDFFSSETEAYRKQLAACSKAEGNVLITDYRAEEAIRVGNRFLRYAMYPDTNISLQIMWGLNKRNTVITLGKSIFNKTSAVNIGGLLLFFGGGGHENAGTCQVDNEMGDQAVREIIALISESEPKNGRRRKASS